MKPKQLILVVLLAAVMGGLGWWVTRHNLAAFQTTGSGIGQKILPDFALNDVAKVLVREGTNELCLLKDQEIWKVRERHQYPANFTEVGDLLRKVWELKSLQIEPVGDSQRKRLHLDESLTGTNAPTVLDFQDGSGKSLGTLLLGKKQMRQGDSSSPFGGEGFAEGRWILARQAPQQAALVSEAFAQAEAKADRWLNKDFFKIEKIQSVEVTHPEATNSWKVYRETEGGELKLADPQGVEKLDTGKASPVGTAFSWPSFVDVVAPDAPANQTGLEQPTVAKIQTFEGFSYTIQVGGKSGEDNYHLRVAVTGNYPRERTAGTDEKPEDKERLDKEFKDKLTKLEDKLKQEQSYAPWTYLVSKWTIDPVLKLRKDLLPDAKTDKPEGAAVSTSATGTALEPVPPEEDSDADEAEMDAATPE